MTEELLWELMIQVGPVVNVHIPRDKVTSMHQVSDHFGLKIAALQHFRAMGLLSFEQKKMLNTR